MDDLIEKHLIAFNVATKIEDMEQRLEFMLLAVNQMKNHLQSNEIEDKEKYEEIIEKKEQIYLEEKHNAVQDILVDFELSFEDD